MGFVWWMEINALLVILFLLGLRVQCEVIVTSAVIPNSETPSGKTSTSAAVFLLLCLFPRDRKCITSAWGQLWSANANALCGWHWSWLLAESFAFQRSGKQDWSMICFVFVMALALVVIYYLCDSFRLCRGLYRKLRNWVVHSQMSNSCTVRKLLQLSHLWNSSPEVHFSSYMDLL